MQLLILVCCMLFAESLATACEEQVVSFKNVTPTTKDYKEYIKNLTCVPRKTVVKLVSPYKNVKIAPEKILVNRCNPCMCASPSLCKPTEVHTTKIAVAILYDGQHKQSDVSVDVPYHTNCSCECSISPQQCKRPKQKFQQNTCSCECVNKYDIEICQKDHKKYWDKHKCACICNEGPKDCTTGTIWEEQICRCVRIIH